MKTRSLVTLGSLALASGALFAQDASSPPTRAEVAQQVLDARAEGALRDPGPVAPEKMTRYNERAYAPSERMRSEVKERVLDARADDALRDPGPIAPEEMTRYKERAYAPPERTRAEMEEQVLDARADGTLLPAGERGLASLDPDSRFGSDQAMSDENLASGSE